MTEQAQQLNLLRLKRVKEKVGLGKSTIHNKIKIGEFPKPIPLGARAVAWLESDIDKWIASRIEAARAAK